MQKRKHLINLLQVLDKHWEPARGLLLLLQNGELDDEVVDTLIGVIQKAVTDTNNTLSTQQRDAANQYLEKIKQLEQQEMKENKEYCDKLLEQI